MERNRLEERVRRLRAWIMVVVTVVACMLGNTATIFWATETLATSKITYSFDGATLVQDSKSYTNTYAETYTQPSSDTYDFSVDCIDTIPYKTGYIFSEWEIAGSGCYYDSSSGTIEGSYGNDYTMTATFVVADKVSVNYDANGGTNTTTSPVTIYQASVGDDSVTFTLADAPTRDGYTFTGWKSSVDNAIYQGKATTSCALTYDEITFTAQWEIIVNTEASTETNSSSSESESSESTNQGTTNQGTTNQGTTNQGTTNQGTTNQEATNPETTTPATTDPETVATEPENQTITGGRVSLQAGETYYLSEGKWQINGDSTIYEGGNAFYVSADGEYEFSAVEEE